MAAVGTSGTNSMTTTLNTSSLLKYNTVNAANYRYGRQPVRHRGQHGAQQQCDRDDGLAGRNNSENRRRLRSKAPRQLPEGVQWLTSDVVDIEGLPASGLTYAMQMSFDEGINSVYRTFAATAVAGSYIAKLVGTHGRLRRSTSLPPGAHAMKGLCRLADGVPESVLYRLQPGANWPEVGASIWRTESRG